MKYIAVWLLTCTIVPMVIYLCVSFIFWDFSFFSEWSKDGRFFYLLLSIGISILISIMVCAIIEDIYRRNK